MLKYIIILRNFTVKLHILRRNIVVNKILEQSPSTQTAGYKTWQSVSLKRWQIFSDSVFFVLYRFYRAAWNATRS